MPRVVYRIVTNYPPADEDYLSFAQLGRAVPPDDFEKNRMCQGLSVLMDIEVARKKGRGRPWHGNAYIAEYELPDDESFVLEQTGRIPTHYTLWCDIAKLRGCLARLVPIMEDR